MDREFIDCTDEDFEEEVRAVQKKEVDFYYETMVREYDDDSFADDYYDG